MKERDKKPGLHQKNKNCRKLLSTQILIKNKVNKYYNQYFEDNWNNMKNTWRGRKNIVIFHLMFLEPFLFMMLLLVTLVILNHLKQLFHFYF